MKRVFSALAAAFTLALSALTAQAHTTPQYTFSQDIAPLVYQHCTSCPTAPATKTSC